VQDARQVFDPLHQVVVLGAVAGDADRVALLEGIRPDRGGRDLTGDREMAAGPCNAFKLYGSWIFQNSPTKS
jgi:hypothetical protein